jgi:opacity protein-like surface antigen
MHSNNQERRRDMKKAANYIYILTLAILITVYPFQSASAQVEGSPAGYQVGGYLGIWGGYTINPNVSSAHYDDWHYHENDLSLDIDETFVFGAKVGYNHPLLRALELELEYSYLNPDITDYKTVVGDIKFNNFMFNIIAKIPRGIIHPYWGAGFGLSHYEMSAKTAEAIGGKDDTSFAWQLLTGVEIDLASNLVMDIGYRYFVTKLKVENNIESEDKNYKDVDFTTSMITLGLKFFF